MRQLSVTAATVILLVSCTKNEMNIRIPNEEATIEFTITCSESVGITARAASSEEAVIRNVDLFLFGANGEKYCFNSAVWPVAAKVAPGAYELFALANCDGVTEDLDKEQLLSLTCRFNETAEAEFVPFSYRGTLSVESGETSSVTIELTRAIAKLTFSIRFKDPNLFLVSAQLCNIPRRGMVFTSDELTGFPASEYFDGEKQSFDSSLGNTYYLNYLMPENRRGNNPSITGQKERSKGSAPEKATYLHLQAKNDKSGRAFFELYIYLGENNMDDFNINRNTNYLYSLVIGFSIALDVDMRVDYWAQGSVSGYNVLTLPPNHDWFYEATWATNNPERYSMTVRYDFHPDQLQFLRVNNQKPAPLFIEKALANREKFMVYLKSATNFQKI